MKRMIAALVASALLGGASAQAPTAGHVTGIGGVFVKSKNPQALAAWYRDVLGVTLESWGGSALRYDAPGHPPAAIWSAFPAATRYLEPSTREFMINLAVDDLDALIAKLDRRGIPVLRRDADANGRFARILDPDGTAVELWEPPKRPAEDRP